MRTMNQFILLFVLLLFGACSKKATTPAAFKLVLGAAALNASSAPGGLALYGKNLSTGETFGRVFQPPYSEIAIELDNGTWDFKALAWTGTMAPMTGVVKCGVADSVEVAGVDIDINMDIDNTSCGNNISHFVSSAAHWANVDLDANAEFSELKLFACYALEGIASAGANHCDEFSELFAGFESLSYKVSLESYGAGAAPSFLSSECYTRSNVSPNGFDNAPNAAWLVTETSSGLLNIPLGGAGIGISTVISVYEGDDCSNNGTSSKLIKQAKYPNGILGGSADMDVSVHLNSNVAYTYLAVNWTGAGYSPLWAVRPIHKCYNGSEISCTPEQSISANTMIAPMSTQTFKVRLPDDYSGTTPDACSLSDVIQNSAINTPTSSFGTDGEGPYCDVTITATATESSFSGGGIAQVFVNFETSGPTIHHTYEMHIFNGMHGGNWQKAHSMKMAAFSVAGYKNMPQVSIHNEADFGSNHGPDEGSDYNGIIKELAEEFSPDSYGGLLYRAGYSTCQDLMTGIGNQHSMTIYDPEDDVTENITFKLLAGTKIRPAFMDNVNAAESAAASNPTLDMRIEIWEDGILDTEIEFDCVNNPARSQVFMSVDFSETNRTEKRTFYISANRDDLSVSSYGVALPAQYSHSSGDVEVEMVSLDSENLQFDDNRGEWYMREDRRIIKYHHAASTSLTKVWMSSSSKHINYSHHPPAGYSHQWFLSRGVARITPANNEISFTFDSMGDDAHEVMSQNSTPSSFMVTTAPTSGVCTIQSHPKTIDMLDRTATDTSNPVNTEPTCDSTYDANYSAVHTDFNSQLSPLISAALASWNPVPDPSMISTYAPTVEAVLDGGNMCDITIDFTANDTESSNTFGINRCKYWAVEKYGVADANLPATTFSSSGDRATVTGSIYSSSFPVNVQNEKYNLSNLQYVSGGVIVGGDYATTTSAFDDGISPLQFNMDYIADPNFELDQF